MKGSNDRSTAAQDRPDKPVIAAATAPATRSNALRVSRMHKVQAIDSLEGLGIKAKLS